MAPIVLLIVRARLTRLGATVGCALAAAASPVLAAGPVLGAGAVASICQPASRIPDKSCEALADGFLSGYLAGVQKGIRSTYEHDPLVLETTRGHAETYERYRQVEAHTLCLPAELSGPTAIGLFLRFMGANPGNEDEPFGDVMEATLDAAYRCPPGAAPAPASPRSW